MKRLKSLVDLAATLLVIVAAGLVIWRQFAPGSAPRAGRPPIEDASGTIAAELMTTVRGTGGVALVEFADFECPFCGRHARDVEPMIRQAFVNTGIVRQVFIHLPLPNHSFAGPASEAALCAGNQGKFWEMHDALFTDQRSLATTDFAKRASEIGLDKGLFERCLETGEMRPTIERHKIAARDVKVQATPAFFVGVVQPDGSVELKKRINGALPFEQFKTAITAVAPQAPTARRGDPGSSPQVIATNHSR